MLECIKTTPQNVERDNRERLNNQCYERVLIKNLQINTIYGTIDDNDKVVILGVLQSNAQCGYADGIMINPTHRCIFTSLKDGKTVKIIKRWNDHLVELTEECKE
jgi:hypothetical protein